MLHRERRARVRREVAPGPHFCARACPGCTSDARCRCPVDHAPPTFTRSDVAIVEGPRDKAGTWRKMRDSRTLAVSASITCPACGRWIALVDHDIDTDGRVYPTIGCIGSTCNWTAHVQLVGWTGGQIRGARAAPGPRV